MNESRKVKSDIRKFCRTSLGASLSSKEILEVQHSLVLLGKALARFYLLKYGKVRSQ